MAKCVNIACFNILKLSSTGFDFVIDPQNKFWPFQKWQSRGTKIKRPHRSLPNTRESLMKYFYSLITPFYSFKWVKIQQKIILKLKNKNKLSILVTWGQSQYVLSMEITEYVFIKEKYSYYKWILDRSI